MKVLTEYLKFHTKTHRAYVHITPQVEEIVRNLLGQTEFSEDKIASLTGVDVEFVREVKADLQNK